MNTNKNNFGMRTLIIAIAALALVLVGASITGAAAQAAIPGDALYSVKTAIEQTRLSLARDAGDRAQMKMVYAEQRLKEISGLIVEGRYREISAAVLAFEADINSALIELETVAETDPVRAASLAGEITSALTRYAQTLSALLASAPAGVQADVNRALDSTNLAGSLDMPSGDDDGNDNANTNANDNGDDNSNSNDNSNDNANDNSNANANANDNGDDNSNDNSNANDNDDDDGNANANDNGDDNANDNGDDNSNDNGDDNSNDNGDDDGGDDNGNDNGNDDDGGDDNGNDNSNANDNGDDDSNDNGDDDGNDNSNDNGGDDDNDNSGKDD